MLLITYMLGNLIGYFIILEIAVVLSIILGKHRFAWIIYGAGALLTFISLAGNNTKALESGLGRIMIPYWIFFIVLMVVGAVGIKIRYNRQFEK